MGKPRQANPFTPIQNKFTNMEKTIKKLKEKNVMQNKEAAKKIKELEKKLKTAESKDISKELSEYAQLAIKDSRGPLEPNVLEKFLIHDVFGKPNVDTLNVIKKYSNNVDQVKEQLSCIHDNVKTYMGYREEQKKLDGSFIKTIKKLLTSIEEAQRKSEMKNRDKYRNHDEDDDNTQDDE